MAIETDVLFDPWDQAFAWATKTGEIREAVNLSGIGKVGLQLDNQPRPISGTAPVTVEVWNYDGGNPPSFKGTQLTEITSGAPVGDQFRVDYGQTNASGDPIGVGTGWIWMDAANLANQYVVDYQHFGSSLHKRNIDEEIASGATGFSPPIGELSWQPFVKATTSAFPYLPAWETQSAIDVLNWPDLQPELYGYANDVDGTTSFSIDSYANDGGGKTRLTLTNNAINQKIADSILAQAVLAGEGVADFTNFWHPVYFPAIVGNIPAGLYEILSVDNVALTLDIDLNFPGSTAAGSFQLRPFADPLDADNARWPGLAGLAIRAPGSAFDVGELFAHIDRFQSHFHNDDSHAHSSPNGGIWVTDFGGGTPVTTQAGPNYAFRSSGSTSTTSTNVNITGPTTDTNLATGTPRLGSTTRDRSRVVPVYLYGGIYNP